MALPPGQHLREDIGAEGSRLVCYAQRLFRPVQAGRENTDDIKALKAKMAELERRIIDLQAREEALIARAEAAASRAAAHILTDLALRIGRMEGGTEQGRTLWG